MATIQPAARLQAILNRFHGIRRNGTGFMAKCPAHEDRTPSLSITESNGKILLHCHAGCTPEAICGALGLTLRDLFDDDNNTGGNNNDPRLTPRPVAYYDYPDEKNELQYQSVRYEPGFDGKKKTFKQRRPDGNGGWLWNIDGVCRILYRLPEVLRAEQVIIVEGEKDSDTVASLALPSTVGTTNVGGCKGKWLPGYTHSLRGKHIVVIPDNDDPGRKHAQEVAASVHPVAASLKVVELPQGKDLTEWIEQGGTKEKLEALIKAVPLWQPGIPQIVAKSEPQPQRPKLPAFPEVAWRGIFSVYRTAMAKATEASDSFHFAALWSRCSATLGRRVSFYQGMWVYPNTYIVSFGPTGDKKTTATRYATNGSTFKVVRGGGSGEGLAEEFSGAAPGEGLLLYAEEFSQVLRPARWEGATLIPFLTQCFDCPERYEMKFRNSPLELDQPTPSLLAGATPEWFWMDFRARDFQGGFGNRLFFFAGTPKAPMALPDEPDLSAIDAVMDALGQIQPVQARFDARARAAWEKFYPAWRQEESGRDDLLLATVKRIPTYIIKLAMTYAALEGTLPEITHDQLRAAILVGQYGVDCAKELLSLQNSGTNPRKELERRILATVNAESDGVTTKRDIYKRLWRHYSDAEAFNRAFDSLLRAGELFTKSAGRGCVLVSTEPMD